MDIPQIDVQKIDEWLLSRVFEPIAWQCARRFRFGHPRLARTALFFSLSAVVLKPFFEREAYVAVSLAICLLMADAIIGRRIERQASMTADGINPLRGLWQYRCILVFCLVVIYATAVMMNLRMHFAYPGDAPMAFTAAVAAIYFACCNSMPPWRRRYRASVRRMAPQHT